jgi:hypothetical protein
MGTSEKLIVWLYISRQLRMYPILSVSNIYINALSEQIINVLKNFRNINSFRREYITQSFNVSNNVRDIINNIVDRDAVTHGFEHGNIETVINV